jgi:hypothetical protein
MRLKRILSIVPVIVLVVLSTIFVGGCSSDGGGGSSTSAVGMMEQLPEGGDYFVFADSKGMRDNDQLQDLYESYSDEVVGDVEDEMGISADDVTAVAISISSSGKGVAIIKGSFDLDDIRDALEDQDFDEDKYRDVETWEGSDDEGVVAFMSDSLVVRGSTMSDVKECIDVIKDGKGSLDEDEDLKDIMDKLPEGLAVGCAEVPSAYISYFTTAYPGYSYLEGLDLAGLSLSVQDENLVLTVVLKFGDESDADDANDQLKDDIEGAIETYLAAYLDPDDVEIDVSQENEYIIVTAEMSLETLADLIEQAMGS